MLGLKMPKMAKEKKPSHFDIPYEGFTKELHMNRFWEFREIFVR